MAIEIVDVPIKNGWIFHSYVNVYQKVQEKCKHLHPHIPLRVRGQKNVNPTWTEVVIVDPNED